jgi:hypothetical protein
MPDCLCFYMDDSGSRDPDHDPSKAPHPIDWFGLGGVLIEEVLAVAANLRISEFRDRWPQIGSAPLHSYEIRNASKAFNWLAANKEIRHQFLAELNELMVALPIYAMACVVHRPGYNERYRGKYGAGRWSLCKTAFLIGVERAAKLARHRGLRLRVFVERSDEATENTLRTYYNEMRAEGMPFDEIASASYVPLTAQELQETLYEFRVKTKTSLVMQVADLALWPVCKGGYEPDNMPLKHLKDHGRLADTLCPSGSGLLGIKYSCFGP